MRATPILASAVAILLVALAGPRLFAGAITAPFDDTVHALGRGDAIPDEALRLALGSRLRATALIGDGRYHADVAALRYADYVKNPDERERLDRVIAAHHDALEHAPSQPFVWSRLALAEMLRHGYSDTVGNALNLSLETGRYEPRLLMPRIELALAVWPLLPETLQREFARQMVLAMHWAPAALVDATRHYHRLAEVRAALTVDREQRARFNFLYERRRLG